ncbi:MAG TPA: antitoxin MazE family protein [Acetobacteraceae bacterium]|nr:antitoxin MazE family protein [Acetobacteraceae bacterium]
MECLLRNSSVLRVILAEFASLRPAKRGDTGKGLDIPHSPGRLHVTYFGELSWPRHQSPSPSRTKVRQLRERLRAQGLRPIQIWVPDVRAPSFRSEARRQSLAVATSAHAAEDQAFIDAVSDRGR